jgi:hypothetical protein
VAGSFLCDRARAWEELAALLPYQPRARWKGVVQVRWYYADIFLDGDDTEALPRVARVGDVALMGDPDLIQAILGVLGHPPS